MNIQNRGHQVAGRNESDIEFVVRTMKEIEYCLSKQTDHVDAMQLADNDEPADLRNLIELFRDHFEFKPAYHRLHDMRHIRNRLVHQVGFDKIGKFNNINRITTRREYEEAYSMVMRELPKAIARKKEASRSIAGVFRGLRRARKPTGCATAVLGIIALTVTSVFVLFHG